MRSLVQHRGSHRAEISFGLIQIYRGWRALLGSAAILFVCVPALAATAPALGTTSTYAVVSSTFTNDGNPTNITGDVCTSTMSGSAAPVASIAGAYTTGSCNGAHATMGTDFTSALATLNGAGQGCINVSSLTGGDSGTLNTVVVPGGTPAGTFPPGCYAVTGAMSIAAGTVTLSGAGVYIFKSTGTFDTTTGTSVAVSGGACEADVFWAPNGATTLATTSSFKGSILDGIANAITVGTTTSIVGRLLSFGGVVTTNTDTISLPTCVAAQAPSSRLVNLSTRGQVQTGDKVMIGGFVIGGSTPKKVLIRAVGPDLANHGVSGVLLDPTLQLYSGQTVLASNDDWGTAANAADIQASTLAPSDAKEAAILTTLNPGAYTAMVSGTGGTTGVAIVEVFELDTPENPLLNISTRGLVQTGDKVLIGGFIIQGDSPQTVLIRAGGPTLTNYGVPDVLTNPKLDLFSGQTIIATNDDWQNSANVAQIQATGLAPANSLESAILISLQPGAYTAIMSGADGGTGVGIVEVFAQ